MTTPPSTTEEARNQKKPEGTRMKNSHLPAIAVTLGTLVGLLFVDDLIALALSLAGAAHLTLDSAQLGWRVGPLVVGGLALGLIIARMRRTKS